MTNLSRRMILTSGAALPFAGAFAGPAGAEAPLMGASFARHRRFMIGDFEVTTILAGTTPREEPQGIFGLNVSPEEFAAVSETNFLSTTVSQFFFTPTVVNTGSELVLFDTGLNGAATTEALASAGYSPDQIDIVVLTHMHGDHIGGMMTDGAPTFANARYVTGQVEFDHWAAQGNEGFDANVRPMADQMTFIGDGGDVVSGITGMAAFGHSPGHMVYRLDSNGAGLVIFADLANHPVWSLARPDWEVRFDADKAMAAQSRRNVLGMIAADRIPAVGYHMPFPAVGYVAPGSDGAEFRWVPEAGQLMG
ncbi:MBL fold metallo-hydrolase [Roseicyclus mahoneyensis]|uniref:Glyoxylase-like metal-dependent hydrolase (Beta-lactamase superfamily II) n=1 Tax=Roseicyclus mahoneyensis TaxID=164332 RepID=A0A316GEE5_9RHOB|nr:MBL fold metallo-hydrolase [Roseicyclus mahoneyensis]PWK59268.1 glyoxylase-like metal-dependent hydrolase (beta-lactamase superfamily II) [Roseicyclus mahoneyensis]